MSRLETAFNDTSKVLDKVSKKRREAATTVSELGDQLETFAMAETYAPLAGGFKRLARTMKVDADLLAAQVRRLVLPTGEVGQPGADLPFPHLQSTNEQVTLGDVFFYQSANAKSAKVRLLSCPRIASSPSVTDDPALQDTLSGRDAVVDEHRRAVKASIAKRREIEKLRSSSSLKADRVNEALEELDEVRQPCHAVSWTCSD